MPLTGRDEEILKESFGTKLKEELEPVKLGEKLGFSASADTDVFDSDIDIPDKGLCRVYFKTDTTGALSAKLVHNGSSYIGDFNEGSDLATGAWYEFDLGVESGDSINYRFSVAATIDIWVYLIRGAMR